MKFFVQDYIKTEKEAIDYKFDRIVNPKILVFHSQDITSLEMMNIYMKS